MSDDRSINLDPLPFDRLIPVTGKGMRELEEALNAGAHEGFRVSHIMSGNAKMGSRPDRPAESFVPGPSLEPVIWMHVSEEKVEYACVVNHLHELPTLQLKEQEGFRIIGQVG